MAKVPEVRSYEQINGQMLASYLSKIGVNDLNTGGGMISFFEAVSQAIYRSSGDVFQIFRDFSVDRAKGEALQRLAKQERVTPIPAKVATGKITIGDSSFEKISTKIYQGADPPNKGSNSILVSDASEFPSTGTIYIGRGTPNIENPLNYTSVTAVGDFYEITLASPTTKFHNTGESVVLAQGGNRLVAAGTVVRTSANGSTSPINFITTRQVTILDGENTVLGVPVAAQVPGTDGNVPSGAIKEFASPPFTGATVTNPNKYTTGRNTETDDELKDRIKKAKLSRGLGTATAIESAVQGVQSEEENAIVASNSIFRTATETTLFFDDGGGYEESTEGVGLEVIVESALGGEQFFQLTTGGSQTSVAKAFLKSGNSTPFNMNPNDRLSLLVGGVLSEHVFQQGDFRANGAATAFEIVSSINSNADLLFSADTNDDGTTIILFAKSETNEFIQKTTPTSGNDAGEVLNLPTRLTETLKLYKNDTPLSRNGRSAQIESENQTDWASTITDGDTLIIKVDGTSFVTYTFNNSDFIDQGDFTTVSKNNTLQSWVDVINAKIIGITASINGTRIVLTSNLGVNSRASIEIDPTSTLVNKGVFTSQRGLTANGLEADYTLNRNTAQIKLTTPLAAGDKLTAGSENTEGVVSTGQIIGGSATLANDADIWFIIDTQEALPLTNGVLNDSLIYLTKESNNIIKFRSELAGAFAQIQEGDYVVMWDDSLNVNNRLEGRVYDVGTELVSNDFFRLKLTADEYTNAVAQNAVSFGTGLAFVRTPNPPQKVSIAAGSYSVPTLSSLIEEQLNGVSTNTLDDEFILVRSNNNSDDGSVLVFTFNDAAQPINFTIGDLSTSTESLFGFSQTQGSKHFPRFIHSSASSDASADPSDSFIEDFDSTLDLSTQNVDPNDLVCFKHAYQTLGSYIEDTQPLDQCAQLDYISGNTLNIDDSLTIKRIRTGDRYYVLRELDINANDIINVILDGNSSEKTFPIKLFRNLTTNAGMPVNSTQFRGYDADGGATTNFSEFFETTFSFKNYKAMMKARNAFDPNSATDEDALFIRSALWGKAGNRYRIGYFYPTAANQPISHIVRVGEYTDINITLKSGDPVANTIDGTTEWDVTITPESASVDQVTYAYSGTGTTPGLASLQPGHYVTINDSGEFSEGNQGTFKVFTANATSFTVRRPSGVAVAENDIATLTLSTISIYEDDDTTADELNTYIADNMSEWITSEILDDNGTTGAGVVDTSTYEDNDFASNSERLQLVDGINWIATSNLAAVAPNPEFTFKNALSLPSYSTNTPNAYTFNGGESVRLIPTTIKHIKEFTSVLAVSGYTTLGEINALDNNNILELSTDTLGGAGSVRVSGGSGNSLSAEVLGTASVVDSDFTRLTISKASSSGINRGSLLKFEASDMQSKTTGFSETTQVTITPNQPNATESTFSLANREVSDRFFGEPRNMFRDRNRAFHVEKHGELAFIAWDEVTGADPVFSKTVDINDAAGGTFDVSINSDENTVEYTQTAGAINFTEVKVGDFATIQNFSNSANNGTFEVAGVSDDGQTLSIINTNGVVETGTVIAAGDIEVDTEIKEGDTFTLGEPFSSLNQGQFRVIKRYNNSIYYENSSVIEERVVVSDNLRVLGFDATTEFDVTVSGDMVIEWNTNGTQPSLENAVVGDVVTLGTDFNASNQGEFMVVESGDNYIKVKNASAVAETGVTITDVFEAHQPAFVFYGYEDTVPGDSIVISGNVLGEGNVGSYTVVEVLNKNEAVVSSVLEAQTSVQLNDLFTQIFVEEGEAYSTYREVVNVATSPANPERVNVVIDGTENFSRINQNAGVFLTSTGKVGLPEETRNGFDSYKYHIGLMAEVNKTIYGDPRDPTTYPGVAAAGANIFHKPPLKRRVVVSINVRVQTGVPFIRITERVRNNIAALINSSDIGQSIAISDIIATVNSIPGVSAVSITSPQFDPNNDVIVVNPSEKALILDLINDITVSKVE